MSAGSLLRKGHMEAPAHVDAWLRLGKERERLPAMPAPAGVLTRGVTVAVCTYKRAASLARFLDSLVTQRCMPDRLIIVDASSDDQTEHAVRNHAALGTTGTDVLYFRVAGPLRGLTRQRNFALRWVMTDLVAFFDDDIVLRPGCCLELERPHREHGSGVIGVAALMENQLETPRLLWRLRASLGIVTTLRPGAYCRSGTSIPWTFLSATEQGLVEGDWLPGCAGMWRTAAAREVGFNEDFSDYCSAEDLDFSLRMRARGALVVSGRARVLHLFEDGGRPDAERLGYMSARNWYDIHRRCLRRRTRVDGAYFVYAFTLDTVLHAVGLIKPGKRRLRWLFIRGRIRFLVELALGRSLARRGA